MARSKRQFVDGRYGQMHTRISRPQNPSQPPVICAHMFPQSGQNFARLMEILSIDRVVVAPDFPGHGESDAPDTPIGAQDYAASFWELIDELGLLEQCGQVDLLGVHAGAKLTVAMAHQRPQQVRKLVLCSAAILLPEEVAQLKKSFKPIPLDESGTRFTHLWKMVTGNRRSDNTLEMCAASYSEILRGGEKYEWGHDAVFEYNLQFPEAVSTLPHPVALLNPGDELYEMTLRTRDSLQDVTYFDLPQWGHGFLEVHAEEIKTLVCTWLDGHHKEKT